MTSPKQAVSSHSSAASISSATSQDGMVVQLDRGFPLVRLENGKEVRCKHATALVKGEKLRAVIGDHVRIDHAPDADMAQIAEILPRQRSLVRRDPAERSQAQTLAANFDTIIVAHPLAELNLNRLERELVLACETDAAVVVALTKADLARETGMQAGTIGWIETGRFIPYKAQLENIAHALGVEDPYSLLEQVS